MPEQKKPATPAPKKTTSRGPTKAAALKALGLTQSDLDELKRLAAEKNIAAEGIGVTVTSNDAPAQEETPEVGPQYSGFYVRNLRNVEVHFRLSRQAGQTEKRTNLNARGRRGDLAKLEDSDLHDEALLTQVNYGLVEIITAGEARKILEGQSTNQQQAVHPAMASLRNELDQPYQQSAVKVEAEYNQQGTVVANLKPQGGEAGEIASQGRGVDWDSIRTQAPIGGNPAIVSDGFSADAAAKADAIARQKNLEGPQAGLGGVKVTIEPTQKT